MVLVVEIWQTQGFENERVFFLGHQVCCFQVRETTSEGVHMKGVVWLTEGTSLVRCAVQHLRSVSESEKRSKTLSDVCHTARFLISRHRQMLLDDAWEEEITGWDPRSTRDPSSGSSF